ncbi:hypothetical protein [Algoriphagus sp. Y33]|uniref:hypothetical protein n=1 Tax=Algoriphagus sp. Y33 TaxID=2772483 RepID=UPI001CE0A012|nr:hypothetical protein [Algoriphagus sp. Y33]
MQKSNFISVGAQALNLRKKFPSGEITTDKDQSLIWKGTLTPSPLSEFYDIKLKFHKNEGVDVWVTNPLPLLLAPNKTKLPHVYDHKRQELCLYFPDGKEWNQRKLLSETILPWTIEWLYHYEIWVLTGAWTGGGLHPKKKKPKNNFDIRKVFKNR